ncbi:uncharacterized protein [Procambarus clarkii]|uniref:uncharacterized protein n=1 Tax=Procambarus clarkii TaxID=6728 RepID=UPI001E676EF2|nr:uncharacterized protein LOC123770293 [Procambarus clarkii]
MLSMYGVSCIRKNCVDDVMVEHFACKQLMVMPSPGSLNLNVTPITIGHIRSLVRRRHSTNNSRHPSVSGDYGVALWFSVWRGLTRGTKPGTTLKVPDQPGCSGYVGLQIAPNNNLLDQVIKSSLASGWAQEVELLPKSSGPD